MIYEKSAGAIVFRKNKENLYLLLYKKAHPPFHEAWDFPKGNIEKGEEEIETVRREIREEAGIKNLEFIPGFREKIKIFYRQKENLILKEIVFYLAKTEEKKVTLSFEHNDYSWLPFKKALEKLTYQTSKKILKKAEKFLVA